MSMRRIPAYFAILLLCSASRGQGQDSDLLKVKIPTQHLHDVVYGHKLGCALTMDVFKPEKPNGIGVIYMVSGGWRSDHSGILPLLATPFTNKNQTFFEVVHGSAPKFLVPEIVQDVHRAIRYIRSHAAEYGVDPNKLAIYGMSSGGHLSLYMGSYGDDGNMDAKDPIDRIPSRVQAVACFFPPTDFLNFGKEGVNARTAPLLRQFWPAVGMTENTPADEAERIARSLSPIYGITQRYPPTLIVHGDADPLIPIQQSQLMIKKLSEAGVKCKLLSVHGKGHGWDGMEVQAAECAKWFENVLLPAPAGH